MDHKSSDRRFLLNQRSHKNNASQTGKQFGLATICLLSLSSGSCLMAADPAPPPKSPGETPSPKPATTNAVPAPPVFNVRGYEITGNTLLSYAMMEPIFIKYVGTNIGITEIKSALSEFQLAYRTRGWATVKVTLPQQSITNGLVKVNVLEGRLAEINVSKNRYFSSNNVMRTLPSLKTNMILNSVVFQEELDRANNASRDRQIFPEVGPGPVTNTSSLFLLVKERIPLHGRLELNNASTPSTPELRVNANLAYNNLWQLDHSVGIQYGFSPQEMKTGDQWAWYDDPLIANYSAFYRMPLANPESVADRTSSNPTAFGYNEGTRKFTLPPSTGLPELNFYGSRSTIDTGVEVGDPVEKFSSDARTITQQDSSEDLTITENLGHRLSKPLREWHGIRSVLSGGVDWKSYDITSFATNTFIFTEHLIDDNGKPFDRVTAVPYTVPTSHQSIQYLPFSLRLDGSRPDYAGASSSIGFSLGWSGNFFPNLLASSQDFESVAGSTEANGHYQIVTASLSRDQYIGTNGWNFLVRADGKWANQPLISNEQYGIGGMAAGVRGYHEGESFGDTGWRVVFEPHTPGVNLGMVDGTKPMIVRGLAFMDYGQTFLLNPDSVAPRQNLWGTGFGFSGSIGHNWDARVSIAWPFISTPTTTAGKFHVYFGIGAQF